MNIPTSTSIVIVGGGVVACGVAYHVTITDMIAFQKSGSFKVDADDGSLAPPSTLTRV
jgi:hypothetical protein